MWTVLRQGGFFISIRVQGSGIRGIIPIMENQKESQICVKVVPLKGLHRVYKGIIQKQMEKRKANEKGTGIMWILKTLHEYPRYLKPWTLWYLSILRSCRLFVSTVGFGAWARRNLPPSLTPWIERCMLFRQDKPKASSLNGVQY